MPEDPTLLRIELTGETTFGRIRVRPARRSVGQWLLWGPPDVTRPILRVGVARGPVPLGRPGCRGPASGTG